MFLIKLILDLFPFIWECFFGNKIPKKPPKDDGTDEKDKDHPFAVRVLKKLLHSIQNSQRLAMALILLLILSIVLNYYFGNRILALVREDTTRRGDEILRTEQIVEDPRAYYVELIIHLEEVYQEE